MNQREFIREIRARAEVLPSYKEFCETVGVSQSYLSHVLSGDCTVSAKFAAKCGYRKIVQFEEKACNTNQPPLGSKPPSL